MRIKIQGYKIPPGLSCGKPWFKRLIPWILLTLCITLCLALIPQKEDSVLADFGFSINLMASGAIASVFILIIITLIQNSIKIMPGRTNSHPDNLYKMLLFESGDGVLLTDWNNNIIEANEKAEILLGYLPGELNGLLLESINCFNEKADLINSIQSRLNRSKMVFETIHKRKEGEISSLEISYSSITFNNFRYIIYLLRDIGERKKSEEILRLSEERYRGIIETANEGIVRCNLNGKITFANHKFANMLGYSIEEIIGMNILDFFMPDCIDLAIQTMEQLQDRNKIKTEYNLLCKNGSFLWVIASASYELDIEGQQISYIYMITDISERKKSEEALRQSEEKHRGIIETANEGIVRCDLMGAVTFVNQKLADMLGYEISEMTRMNTVEFFDPADLPDVMNTMQQLQQGKKVKIEYRVICKDRSFIWVIASASGEVDYEGRLIGYIYMVTDITERKIAENMLRCQAEVLNNLHDAVIAIDSAQKVTQWNRAAEVLYGMRAKEAQGRDLGSLFKDRGLSIPLSEVMSCVDSKGYFNGEVKLNRKNGDVIWVETSAIELKTDCGEFSKYAFACRDITERKDSEIRLMKFTEELKELNAAKDKFFSIIAHDLKNPISSFKQITELMHEQYDSFDDSEKQELLSDLRNSSKTLFELLEDLLTWSRSQRGTIEFNPVQMNLKYISNQNIALLRLSANNKNINIHDEVDSFSTVMADPCMLTTIIRNLMSNAIKFTPENGSIQISSTHSKENPGFIQISVSDTGIGITDEIKSKLFKIDSTVTTTGTCNEIGTGLGLIICKEFVEKHGGRIWVDSKIGHGTTFHFTLPKVFK